MKATGSPIALGTIVTNQPGTSFTDIANMASAYFTCVNDNGGVNGHPIRYYIEDEQTNPGQIAGLATKLVQTDHVIGIFGNTSIIECSVDHNYWQKLGFNIIDSGIAPECWSTPNSAAVNMGPRYSSQMGFTEAEIAVHALQTVKGASTVKSVNAAFKAVQNFNTGMLCQLWSYGSYPMHIPNNEDYTVTPSNGKMVTAQGCTQISSVDPQIAAYRQVAGVAKPAS